MRLCAFIVIVLIAFWTTQATDPTPLALRQFQNDGAVPEQLQQAAYDQNYGPLFGPALALAVGVLLFWEDAKRWWKKDARIELS
jgi:hypothetical protein